AAQATVSPYVRTLLAQINQYRQDNGLTPLVLDPALSRAARTHSFSMFQQKRLSHLRFNERFQQTNSRLCVENIGRGATNPRKQFDNWRRSGAHDQNLLVEEIRRAGIAEVGGFVTFFACQ
ncbi:MAG: CAP domain-containing protein, partial [Desulfobulbaceae bacterium]|nr:CAP domain-containing protein [Desulfobulbaceae bacterium]